MKAFAVSISLVSALVCSAASASKPASFDSFKSFFGEHHGKIEAHLNTLKGGPKHAWAALTRGMGYLAKRFDGAVRSAGTLGLGLVNQHTRWIRNVLSRAAASGKAFGGGLVKWVKAQFVDYTKRAAGYLQGVGATGLGFVRGAQAMAGKFFSLVRDIAASKQKWSMGTFAATFKGFGQILSAAAKKTLHLQKTDKPKVQAAFDATLKGVVQAVKGN